MQNIAVVMNGFLMPNLQTSLNNLLFLIIVTKATCAKTTDEWRPETPEEIATLYGTERKYNSKVLLMCNCLSLYNIYLLTIIIQ